MAPSEPLHSKFFSKTLILAFEANRALSHENETKIARFPQRLKSTFFEIFSHSAGPFGNAPFEIFSKNVDF